MNGILVVLEHRGGAWNRLSWEAIAAAGKLAQETGHPLSAAVLASSIDPLLPSLMGAGLTSLYAVQHTLLASYTADGYVLAQEQLIRKLDPAYIVYPHTYDVRDYAPRLAARFEQVLIPDVIDLQFRDGRPLFVRQLLQGKLQADYSHPGTAPCFFSVQAGSFRADGLASASPPPELFVPELQPAQIRTQPGEPFREAAQTVDLSSANIIVSVGRGIKEKENLPIVEALADALGAELAASRPICDNGWVPMERQVGSSGQTVSPKVYIAVGISGAIQHLVGMKGSKSVVAINKDENAPIFEVADYGIVGDLFDVIPALTDAVKRARA